MVSPLLPSASLLERPGPQSRLLVLLHGYVGDGPTTWRRQLDDLSGEFTVVAWDAPGAGRSSDPPETFGMAGYADCLAGFIGALGLTDPHIVGLSFGGALAIELCRRHPVIPRSLVLESAYAGWAGSLPAEVTAADIETTSDVEILNPETVLANLNSDGHLAVDITVAQGRGYLPVDRQSSNTIGVIPLDAIFSPVRRVTFQVESTRVEQSTEFDRLLLDIETDGSISARESLASAGSPLRQLV